MTAPEVELRTAWQRLAGRGHDEPFESLLARLREPHRHYHTAAHVMWVLRHVDVIITETADERLDADAVQLAALWHDAVYDPTATDNEEASARLGRQVALRLGWAAERADLVAALIESTAPGSPRGAAPALPSRDAVDEFDVLHDADLAILASEPAAYQAYVNSVRREYSHVPDDAWRKGRGAVLTGLLDNDPLYRTPAMAPRAARAQANLAAELAALVP